MAELAGAAPSKFWQWRFPNPLQCCLPEPPPQFHSLDDAPLLQPPPLPAKTYDKSCKLDVRIEELIASINSLSDPDHSLENLRLLEKAKPPTTLPPHIDPRSRAYCIDCLADAADKFCYKPSTLHLAVHYFDRYLSQNDVGIGDLRLLGLACLMIAAKNDGVGDQFQFDKFWRRCQSTIDRDDLIQMEKCVQSFLRGEAEAEAVTAWSFLERFLRVGGGGGGGGELECVARYIAEVSLLSSRMVGFLPSMVAASALFLAQYVLEPWEKSWSGALRHYTMYQPSDLRDCVVALHDCCYGSGSHHLPAITIKYSKKNFQYVSFRTAPRSIPLDIFQD